MKALVIFDSKYGQTKKIAARIAEGLKDYGNTVTLQNAQNDMKPPAADTDLVVVGGPVYQGGYPAGLKEWVELNRYALNKIPSYFFSVCLGILQDDEKVKLEEKKIVEKFLTETGFHPSDTRIFAGALPYSQYNFFIRFIMKRIVSKAGGDTDTTKDYEYTDWREVSRFVEMLQASQPRGPGPRLAAERPVMERR